MPFPHPIPPSSHSRRTPCQVSYFAPHSEASSGTYTFAVTDTDGDAAFNVDVYHGGIKTNPLPFPTEVLVLLGAIAVHRIVRN